MLKNYIKLSLKVLRRKKFFTFINLFGISFTILILMVAISMIDHVLHPKDTEIQSSRMLFVEQLVLSDTAASSISVSGPSYTFLKNYAKNLKTPEMIATYSGARSYITFVKNRKLEIKMRAVDTEYWEVYKFNFLTGRAFNKNEFENAEKVAVVSESIAKVYFNSTDVIGNNIDVRGQTFRIIGIIKDVPAYNANTHSDVYIPTLSSRFNYSSKLFGEFNAAILAYDDDDFVKIRKEYFKHMKIAVKEMPDQETFQVINCKLYTHPELINKEVIGQSFNDASIKNNATSNPEYIVEENISQQTFFYLSTAGIMLLFMLIPSLNMININMSRIIERASEIGVRRAFGAKRTTLIFQFLVENVIITFIGGVISFILTLITLSIINSSGIIPYAEFTININIFLLSVVTCFVFGVVSGVYPAFKMSRLNPVEALRGGSK